MSSEDSPFAKIAADMRHYARTEGRSRVSPGFALRMILVTPGFQFVLACRIQEIAALVPVIGRPIRRVLWWLTCLMFGSELAIGARIAGGLYIPHPYGIVVGVSTIGRDVKILQNVTIGRRAHDEPGEPVIGDNVSLSAGAVIVGSLTIGANSIVGANSVVLRDVPPDSVAVGIPANIRSRPVAATS